MRILLSGASSQIGDCLLPLLVQTGHRVNALSRQTRTDTEGIRWCRADLDQAEALSVATKDCEMLIHLAPVWNLPHHLPDLARAGIRRVFAFSSTSRFGKRDSPDPSERKIVRRLVTAESSIIEACERHGMAWTLFRPTLIYGMGRDRNVSNIARFIHRFHFFPIAGDGAGLRQPVHACDLAQACLDALRTQTTASRAYNLSGGEILPYHRMVERIFEAQGRKPHLIRVPLPPLRLFLHLLGLLPGYRYLGPEMANRMNRDLVYDHAQARADFDYLPRGFTP